MERQNYPPRPSLPKEAPWKEVEEALSLLRAGFGRLENTVRLAFGLPAITGPGQKGEILRTGEISLQNTVPSGQGVVIARPSPYKGRMTLVTRHWPNGCNGLVDVAVGRGQSTWVMPYLKDEFVALNDVTLVVPISEPVDKSEKVWIIVRNRDALNPHYIAVTVVIEGVE